MGSGVIIREEGLNFYVSTNSHVVSKTYVSSTGLIVEAPYVKYTIEDYLNRQYIGELVIDGQSNKSTVNHDLAIIKFILTISKEEANLNVIPISETYDQSQLLAIVGQPLGQKNTITFGMHQSVGTRLVEGIDGVVKSYEAVDISAPGAGGSSGSMVINQFHEIVGIVFAGAKDTTFIESEYMIMVPLSYVHSIINELDLIINPILFNPNYTDTIYYQSGVV